MEALSIWWGGLQPLNQWFFVAAAFFSVFFLWQLVMAFAGLGGGEAPLDSHVEHTWEHQSPSDADQTVLAFKFLSFRSIVAFFTLFTWAGALYMNGHTPVSRSIGYALIWGAVAMVLVSLLFHTIRKLAETGNMKIGSCVGAAGTVYLDIPAGGVGEVRLLCGGAMTHFKARSAGGQALKAGSPVRVLQVTGSNTLEVELGSSGSDKERKEKTS